jgi:hypothetical protein
MKYISYLVTPPLYLRSANGDFIKRFCALNLINYSSLFCNFENVKKN